MIELLLFSAAGYLADRYVVETRATLGWVERSREVLEEADLLRVAMLRLATRALYYLHFGTENIAGNMVADADDARHRLARMKTMAAGDAEQLQRVNDTNMVVEARLALFARLTNEHLSVSSAPTTEIVRKLYESADSGRDAVLAFRDVERRKLRERQEASALTLQRIYTMLVMAFGTAFLFCIVATALFLAKIDLQRRRWLDVQQANAAIARQHELVRNSERRLNAVLEHGRDGIMLISPGRDIILANAACAALLAAAADDLIGRQITDFLPEFDMDPGKLWSSNALRLDGSTFAAEVTTGRCALDEGPTFVCIMRDVTERQRLEQIKDDFVSTVSHELRTPLTSIRGSLGLITGNAAGDVSPKVRALLRIAHANSERLVELINNLLDIEKIETHRIEMPKERVEIHTLVTTAVEANQAFATFHHAQLRITGDPGSAMAVLGNFGRLQQVLANLISNAVKFSPKHGQVLVGVEGDADRVTVSVRDFGPGIPDSFKPRLFTRFAQAESGDARRSRGTGLGLSIVKAIIEQHGGTVSYVSPLPDGGSRFWITLARLQSGTAGTQPAGAFLEELADDR
ncbi:MAG: ATP-binding protein [Geminicoccaceae bacterium]